jgi:hypothetical protein
MSQGVTKPGFALTIYTSKATMIRDALPVLPPIVTGDRVGLELLCCKLFQSNPPMQLSRKGIRNTDTQNSITNIVKQNLSIKNISIHDIYIHLGCEHIYGILYIK